MTMSDLKQDAIVVGGGFYGAAIAIYLVKRRGFKRVTLIEAEAELLQRASYNNQARVHNGYHYPRSFTTAFRSRVNYPKFLKEWPNAITKDFTKVYAIARNNSNVTARQFYRFCQEIGSKIDEAGPSLKALFEPRLIEDVFLVDESAFDSAKLKDLVMNELNSCGINILFETKVLKILNLPNHALQVVTESKHHKDKPFNSSYIFNCTYSGINQFDEKFSIIKTKFKHEITEIALVKPPPALADYGITVMDGPFFSIMPFPSRDLHSFSHVRYTPHTSWNDSQDLNPYLELSKYKKIPRIDWMIRDASRYLPEMHNVKYKESLFEVKTILLQNEGDDGRPILFEKNEELKGLFSILGSKIDNIYDVLEKLDAESFEKILNIF
jgi:glycine/D-amino acid oxidase-like deaminating enzyme